MDDLPKQIVFLLKQSVVASKLLESRLTELDAHLTSGNEQAIEKCRQDCVALFEAFVDSKIRMHKAAERLGR